MMNKTSKIVAAILLLVLLVLTFMNKNYVYDSSVNNRVYNTLVEKKDINDELLDSYEQGFKKINIFVDKNTISFDKSNTVTELNYALYNIINNSDKTTWNIITNNLVEKYEVVNNRIEIKDNNIDTISFSFMYNGQEYNLSLIKNVDKYVLVESKIKLLHGGLNSLWYTYFNDLDTAIKASANNDYIVLCDDINVNKTIDINKNITIMSKPGNIYSVFNNEGFLFNMKSNKVTISNVLINTDSFIEGKVNTIYLDNTKVVYKDKIFPKKSNLKSKVKTKDINVFNKASL